jgi:hypothetical protein
MAGTRTPAATPPADSTPPENIEEAAINRAVKLRPPVVARDIDSEMVEAMTEQINALEKGEFASDGESYPDRSKASVTAAKFVRVIESKGALKLRSRTWESPEGGWVFGIRPKD